MFTERPSYKHTGRDAQRDQFIVTRIIFGDSLAIILHGAFNDIRMSIINLDYYSICDTIEMNNLLFKTRAYDILLFYMKELLLTSIRNHNRFIYHNTAILNSSERTLKTINITNK